MNNENNELDKELVKKINIEKEKIIFNRFTTPKLNNNLTIKDIYIENLERFQNLHSLSISDNDNIVFLNINRCSEIIGLTLIRTKIEEVNISKHSKIRFLSLISNQYLRNINFIQLLNPNLLTHLEISNNSLNLNTSMFANFINLKELIINDSNCSGSLLEFRNLNDLKEINILNTDIIPSFEYLNSFVQIQIEKYENLDNSKKINNFLNNNKKNEIYLNQIDLDIFYVFNFKKHNPLLVKNSLEVIEIIDSNDNDKKEKLEKLFNFSLNYYENIDNFVQTEVVSTEWSMIF